eukprot:scaffold90817_cov45-Phaeocystis_antarctica.AAC.1
MAWLKRTRATSEYSWAKARLTVWVEVGVGVGVGVRVKTNREAKHGGAPTRAAVFGAREVWPHLSRDQHAISHCEGGGRGGGGGGGGRAPSRLRRLRSPTRLRRLWLHSLLRLLDVLSIGHRRLDGGREVAQGRVGRGARPVR